MTAASASVDEDWGRLRSQLRRTLGPRLADSAEAEDVVQEVLLRVLRHGNGLRDAARFDAWLATTTRNALADHLRARQRHPLPRDAEAPGPSDEQPTPEGEDTNDARQRVAQALRPFAERLPAIYREVIILSELEGVPHAEIARRLAISVSGVKSRVQRGRDQLQKMLTDCCEISLDARNTIVECVPRQPAPTTACCGPDSAKAKAPPPRG